MGGGLLGLPDISPGGARQAPAPLLIAHSDIFNTKAYYIQKKKMHPALGRTGGARSGHQWAGIHTGTPLSKKAGVPGCPIRLPSLSIENPL